MASSSTLLISALLILPVILTSHYVKCDDEEEALLQGLNQYRTSQNLTSLRKNDNAECFAEELVDQFKHQPCTNSTGANTVPGTETQIPNYESLLAKCHLNITATKDGMVMPVCVPHLVPSLVLTNYTESQYNQFLNDTKFTGAGIASEDDWIVVVLTSNTPEGSYTPATSAASLESRIGLFFYSLIPLMGFLFPW